MVCKTVISIGLLFGLFFFIDYLSHVNLTKYGILFKQLKVYESN